MGPRGRAMRMGRLHRPSGGLVIGEVGRGGIGGGCWWWCEGERKKREEEERSTRPAALVAAAAL